MHAALAQDARIAELEAALASERARSAQLEREKTLLQASHERLRLELKLLKMRLFVAKAERVDTAQLEMEFAQTLRALDAVAGTLGMAMSAPEAGTAGGAPTKKRMPTGRRDLRALPLEERRVEIEDPLFEELIVKGKAERFGFEESCKLAWQRGGMRRLVVARVKYRTVGHEGDAAIETAELPEELLPRSLAAPSLLARIVIEKYCDGLPLFRMEERFARDGVSVDRGSMSRWLEDIGGTLGATVVEAMRQEAMRTAFCIATDATGVAVQPPPMQSERKTRQACRKGHYFVQVVDTDAIFFEYTAKENSAAVSQLFKGFQGYVQADAKSVFNVLFERTENPPDGEVPDGVCEEVGCWSHLRRYVWEAAMAKSVVAREGLARISRIFKLEDSWKDKPSEDILRLRQALLRPHVEAFFVWAASEYENVRHQRGLLRKAFGYALRQQHALCRFLEDGRLEMTNNRSELALRKIAVGRKAWLFAGSDDHAQSAGHLFTLVASARLHKLDPESYLRDLIRVLPHWPRERFIELAPKYWLASRARLNSAQLADEVGPLAVPSPTTEQESASG